MPEDCSDLEKQDEDGDEKKNCADPDCYQKSCDSYIKNKICQTDSAGRLTENGCKLKPCSSGEITLENAGCECVPGSNIGAEAGDYCCTLNNVLYGGNALYEESLYTGASAQKQFIASPCGNTLCRLNPINPEKSGTCCKACESPTHPSLITLINSITPPSYPCKVPDKQHNSAIIPLQSSGV
ncbi:hypothetical protein J4410_05670 [Candidatus Woesearchaeota archaeon]|nr:hypothetical protein [Candidatus Woesearchaeota archaeon]